MSNAATSARSLSDASSGPSFSMRESIVSSVSTVSVSTGSSASNTSLEALKVPGSPQNSFKPTVSTQSQASATSLLSKDGSIRSGFLPQIDECLICAGFIHFILVGVNAKQVMLDILTRAKQEFPINHLQLGVEPPGPVSSPRKSTQEDAWATRPSTRENFALSKFKCTVQISDGWRSSDSRRFSSHSWEERHSEGRKLSQASAKHGAAEKRPSFDQVVPFGARAESGQDAFSSDDASDDGLQLNRPYESGSTTRDSLNKRLIDLYWMPVEKFIDDIPQCISVDHWRHTCVLLLVDPRTDRQGYDVKEVIERRLLELDFWARDFSKVFRVSRTMPMQTVVLAHGQRCADSSEDSSEAAVKSEGKLSLEPRYMELVTKMCKTMRIQDSSCQTHYLCDFDDGGSLLHGVMKIADDVLNARKKHDLWQSEVPSEEERRKGKKSGRSSFCAIA